MADNSKFRRVFNSKPFLFLILVVLVWVVISVVKVSHKRYLLRQEVLKLQQELSQIENKNIEFSEYIQYLQSDSFIEKEARDKLNLRKEGEEVIIIPGIENQEVSGTSQFVVENQPDPQKEKSFWWKWWEYFFE